MDLTIVKSENHADIYHFLDQKIYEHNSRSTGKSDGESISFVAHNGSGEIIAGITGWVWASVCEITYLWVDDAYRSKGVGKALLNMAENEAIQHNAHSILLRSYDFQAPDFYKKQGYGIVFVLENFPFGFDYYCLSKRLDNNK